MRSRSGTDGVDHTVDTHSAELPHPVGPLHRQEPVAELLGKLTAQDRQVLAAIAVLGDELVVAAERLGVPDERRLVEQLHLRAGVVDVVLAADVEAGGGERLGECAAEHGAARVADVYGPGRVDAHKLDLDGTAPPQRRRCRTPRRPPVSPPLGPGAIPDSGRR